jgi:hypothetical protein
MGGVRKEPSTDISKVKTHQQIDHRSLRLARVVAEKLEAGNLLAGLARARAVNERWRQQASSPLHEAWRDLLAGDWPSIRAALLDASERGAQLRQNNPFCGILTPRERWDVYRQKKGMENGHDA